MGFDIDTVLAQATTEELAALVNGDGAWGTTGIPRLGVPGIVVADGPHGLRVTQGAGFDESAPATCFPPAAGLGSSWNPPLAKEIGAALAVEASALGVDVVLGPGINIKRFPLGGRNFEYVSEDPLLTGAMASAMVYGLQSQGVGACPKHFAANNQETDRMRVDVRVSERALREIYLPAFRRTVTAARPWTLMCSYNRLNGTLVSQHPWLLTEVLREEWGFDGVVMSDWGAVYDRTAALQAGLDLEMPHVPGTKEPELLDAVSSGELTRADLERSARRLLLLTQRVVQARARRATGLDAPATAPDAPATAPDASAPGVAHPGGAPAFDVDAHHDLARRAAHESMVLLANSGVLPLDQDVRVALIGEFARTPRYQGGGSSKVNPTRLDRLVDTLAARREVAFAPGFRLDGAWDDDLADEALAAAEASDVVVLCLGLPTDAETEGIDRVGIDLPTNQVALLAALAELTVPIVVVLSHGAPVSVSGWADQADALLEGWLGGQAGALALADVLVGHAEPSGRLAETLPVRLEDEPSFLMFPGQPGHVVYGEDVFVGYRGFDALDRAVAFPFGFGLGYTTFRWDALAVKASGSVAARDLRVDVHVKLTNTGERRGSEVVQVYVRNADASVPRPVRELRAFTKVTLEPGESRTVVLPLDAHAFEFWSQVHGRWLVESGEFGIEVGPNSRDLPLVKELRLDVPALRVPLHDESTILEWRADEQAWEALMALTQARGGAFELDDELLAVVGGQPLRRFAMFPGVEVEVADVDAVLASHGTPRR